MQPVTDRFLEEIKGSHTVYSYVVATTPNNQSRTLAVTSGSSVTVDGTAQIRRYGTINLIDPSGDIEDILAIPGTEIRPYRGVKYTDGTLEVCPLGVLRVSQVQFMDSLGGSRIIQVQAYDRSRTVTRDQFTVPYIINAGTNIVDAIQDILGRTFDDLEYDAISTTLATSSPKMYDAQSDPWAACVELAQSIGCDIFFDPIGHVTIAPPVDIDSLPAPDFSYVEGPGAMMLDVQKTYSDEPGYNGVVMVGESVGDENPPVMSIQWDTEPTSPTYHLGPYGEVPYFIQDQNIKTQTDADNAALAILKGLLGFSVQLVIDSTFNPALDAGDIVKVVRARSNVNDLYVIDSISQPMSAGDTAQVTLRQKRVGSTG